MQLKQKWSEQKIKVGVGLRAKHYPLFFNQEARPKTVDFVQVISENFMEGKFISQPRPLRNLIQLRKDLPISLHGVSMSLGSCDGLDFQYLQKLKDLIEKVEPIQVSDHLCWTRTQGRQTHDLNPLPYTLTFKRHLVEQILRAQDFLKRQILIENVSSYVSFEVSEKTEAEFLSEVVKEADCGLLLDINNVYVSSQNHGFDPKEYLRQIPNERVKEIHLAGHTKRKDGFLIDTHDEPVCDAVWSLFSWYGNEFGFSPALIERDAQIPEWDELEQEVIQLKSKMTLVPNSKTETVISDYSAPNHNNLSSTMKWTDFEKNWQHHWVESLFSGEAIQGIQSEGAWSGEERFQVYQSAFWIRIESWLAGEFPELRKNFNADSWLILVKAALMAVPAHSWTLADLGESFVTFLKQSQHEFTDVAEKEWAQVKAQALKAEFDHEVNRNFQELSKLNEQALSQVRLMLHPSHQALIDKKTLIWYASSASHQQMSDEEWAGFLAVKAGTPLTELAGYQSYFQNWVQSGIIYGWKKNCEQ